MPAARPKTCPLCKRHFPTMTLFKLHIFPEKKGLEWQEWPSTCCHKIRDSSAHRCSRCDDNLNRLSKAASKFLAQYGAL
jgi:hypothetical protein